MLFCDASPGKQVIYGRVFVILRKLRKLSENLCSSTKKSGSQKRAGLKALMKLVENSLQEMFGKAKLLSNKLDTAHIF